MKLSEVSAKLNSNSDKLDTIAARIGGSADPEVPADLVTALDRQDTSIAAIEVKLPPAP